MSDTELYQKFKALEDEVTRLRQETFLTYFNERFIFYQTLNELKSIQQRLLKDVEFVYTIHNQDKAVLLRQLLNQFKRMHSSLLFSLSK